MPRRFKSVSLRYVTDREFYEQCKNSNKDKTILASEGALRYEDGFESRWRYWQISKTICPVKRVKDVWWHGEAIDQQFLQDVKFLVGPNKEEIYGNVYVLSSYSNHMKNMLEKFEEDDSEPEYMSFPVVKTIVYPNFDSDAFLTVIDVLFSQTQSDEELLRDTTAEFLKNMIAVCKELGVDQLYQRLTDLLKFFETASVVDALPAIPGLLIYRCQNMFKI